MDRKEKSFTHRIASSRAVSYILITRYVYRSDYSSLPLVYGCVVVLDQFRLLYCFKKLCLGWLCFTGGHMRLYC
jgi:hypothetical protein